MARACTATNQETDRGLPDPCTLPGHPGHGDARPRNLALAIAAVCFLISEVGSAHAQIPAFARTRPQAPEGPPSFAFNGRNLDGFYTFLKDHGRADPDQVFAVRDGLIVVSGNGFGGLVTEQEFANYHLLVEWRWGEKTWPPRERAARDSGILLHCVGADGAAGGMWMESIECQMIEGGSGDFILVGGKGKPMLTVECRFGSDGQPYFEKGGVPTTREEGRFNWWGRDPNWQDVLGMRGPNDVEKPVGAWNRMEVFCDGGTITNVLNDVVVNVGAEARPRKGKILFQTEGAEIHFRKIEVRPLGGR